MCMKVQIKDYQIIKQVSLEFHAGLNVIVGPSNNGKSSIFKAIKSALYTIPGTTSIRLGQPYYLVGIEYNGHTLAYKKSAKDTVYLVDGESFTKFGTTTPSKVSESLNLKELTLNGSKEHLNFWDQMNYPFLLDRTPGDLFKFIVDSGEDDQVSKALKSMVSDRQQISRDVDKLQGSIDLIDTDINNYESMLIGSDKKINVCNEVLSLKSVVEKCRVLNLLKESLVTNLCSVEGSENKLNSLKKKLSIYKEFRENAYNALSGTSDLLQVRSNFISNIDKEINLHSKLATLQKLLSLDTVSFNNLEVISNLSNYRNKIINLDDKINNTKSVLKSKNKIISLDKLDYSRLFYMNDLKSNLFVLLKRIEECKPIKITKIDFRNDLDSITEMLGVVNQINTLNVREKSINVRKIETLNNIKALQDIRNNLGVCPYCGNKIGECDNDIR